MLLRLRHNRLGQPQAAIQTRQPRPSDLPTHLTSEWSRPMVTTDRRGR